MDGEIVSFYTEIAMQGDDQSKTVTRDQWAVRLTYTDGRVRYHIRADLESAERYIDYVNQIRAREDWGIATAEIVKREIVTTIGAWTEG